MENKRRFYTRQVNVMFSDDEFELLRKIALNLRGTKAQVLRLALINLSKETDRKDFIENLGDSNGEP